MPFDGTAYQRNANTQAAHERWDVVIDKKPEPRAIQPMSDAQALYAIWRYLETRWARKLNDGENHCVLGWVSQLCSPMTIIDWKSPQMARLVRRLHDALPRQDQRRSQELKFVVAKYNDTHELADVRDVVMRAYLAEVNAAVDKLNG